MGRWTGGKDAALDVGLLAMHEAALVVRYVPEIKNFRLSEDMSKIVDANGAEVSQRTLDDIEARARDAGALGIGETTLRRAIVTRTAALGWGETLRGKTTDGQSREFGVHQGAVEHLLSDFGSTGSGLDPRHPLSRIAYAEGQGPGPLVANLPRAVRNSGGGWTLHDRATGREIGRAATTDEAIRLAGEHAGLDQKDAASMAFLETMFQGTDLSGQLHDTLGLTARTEADISTALESDAATRASAELKARAEAQERTRGGDGSFARLIFGSSTMEIIGNARRVINRILGGGSILTVFHEEGHSLRKAARAAGILTREDDIRMLRAADKVLAGKSDRRGGGRLSFLPENFDSLSEADQDVAIDEGISELLEAEILRTRKGGGARQLPPGLVSRNLSAFSQLAGDRTAGRYRSFIGAFRQFFGLQMGRALEIQRALENGTLDRNAYEGYLRKLYNGDIYGALPINMHGEESCSSISFSLGPEAKRKILDGPSLGNVSTHDILIIDRKIIQTAVKWIKDHPQPDVESIIGRIRISPDDIQNSFSHTNYPNKLAVIPKLGDVLKDGVYIGKVADWVRPNSDNHYFVGPIEIDGSRKLLFVRVLEDRRSPTHLHVHEVFTDEEIERSEGMQTSAVPSLERRGGNPSDLYRSLIKGIRDVE